MRPLLFLSGVFPCEKSFEKGAVSLLTSLRRAAGFDSLSLSSAFTLSGTCCLDGVCAEDRVDADGCLFEEEDVIFMLSP